MKTLLIAALLALAASAASAQTASETTTTQTTAPAPIAPLPGTLSTSRETHAVDAYGNRVDSSATSYSNGANVTRDNTVTRTSVAPPPPPPVTTTTSSSTTTTTTAVPN